MKIITFLFLLTFMMTQIISGQEAPPIEAGVAQSLAKWRAANYSDVRYKLNITLEKMAPLMKGTIEVSVKLTETGAKNDLILDWRTTQFANDKDKPFAEVVKVNESLIKKLPDSGNFAYAIDKEHIIIAQRLLKTGENVIRIEFASPVKTSGAAVTRYVDKEDGAEYVYSLFVPSDASTAFPVFDQPDLKARFQLTVQKPKEWKAVSNTKGKSSGENIADWTGDCKSCGTFHYTEFEETKPISTYVFAFAAGDFLEYSDMSAIGPVKTAPAGSSIIYEPFRNPNSPKIYIRKSQAAKFRIHEKEVFRLNREGVKFLQSWFDYKFPFPKYDLVLIPEFPFGGMEHAGATFLREDRIIFPTEPTKNDFITRANLIFHEAAHQWFGDTVTMKWFDDLWLKEGFAEFMAYKTLEKVMPEYNAWKIFYERNKQAAYLTDITRGTTPIYQEISNLSAAKSAYGNIVYRKAPSFLRQAEFYLGEKEFQTAVRSFLKKHEFKNAEWTDLVSEFETASKQDLKDWANVWVKKAGLPIIKVVIEQETFERIERVRVIFRQTDSLTENGFWKQKFNVVLFGNVGDGKEKLYLNQVEFEDKPKSDKSKNKNLGDISIFWSGTFGIGTTDYPSLARLPKLVFPNPNDYAYGIFLLDKNSRNYIINNIHKVDEDFVRSMMWGSLWDSVRFYEFAPEDYVKLVIKKLGVETDESTVSTLLGRVGVAMNYYLPEEQAKQFAPNLENLLIEKMQNAPTLGLRITYYRAFLNIASSEKARNVLKEMFNWNTGIPAGIERADGGKTAGSIPEFQLKAKDKFDIITRLIILGDPDGLKLLAELEKTESGDAAKRYAYAARAGIPTAENKAKFWKDFTENKEISESWIESAFVVWNSTKHADLTLPYLEKALAELPNLKKNRKIFFVNGWLSSFIGGQRSAEALKIVNDFLEKNPNLDRDLRLKVLENVDGLERAVKIREKFVK